MSAKNLAASVQARLQKNARTSKRPFQELLQYYAMERFLYRLSKTPHHARFVLKGALMLQLAQAITATFANRQTDIDVAPIAFTPEFTEQGSTVAQWSAFRSRLPNAESPVTLTEVVTSLAEFLLPIARACASGETFDKRWSPGGPWATGP